MSLEENKALVRRFIDKVINGGKTASISEFCLENSMFAGGIEGQIKTMRMAFPDHRTTIDDILAEGDKVAVRVTTRGTNTGPMAGFPAFGRFDTPVPPTGRKAMGSALYLFTVADGKIVSLAMEMDQIGLLRQLGWTFSPSAQA